MNVVFQITHRNGKIHIGQDRSHSINFFGRTSSALMAGDCTDEERRTFSIKREILWESEIATRSEVTKKELERIVQYRSNDPAAGYNQ